MEYECGESHLWKDSAYYEEVDKRQGQRNIGDGFIRAEFINARHYEWYIFYLYLRLGHQKLKVENAHAQRVAIIHPYTPSKNENEILGQCQRIYKQYATRY